MLVSGKVVVAGLERGKGLKQKRRRNLPREKNIHASGSTPYHK